MAIKTIFHRDDKKERKKENEQLVSRNNLYIFFKEHCWSHPEPLKLISYKHFLIMHYTKRRNLSVL